MLLTDDASSCNEFAYALLTEQPRHHEKRDRRSHRWRRLQALEVNARAVHTKRLVGTKQPTMYEQILVIWILKENAVDAREGDAIHPCNDFPKRPARPLILPILVDEHVAHSRQHC